jgi:hypothetical protein
MLQTIAHHFPSGTSLKSKMHALQNYHSGCIERHLHELLERYQAFLSTQERNSRALITAEGKT